MVNLKEKANNAVVVVKGNCGRVSKKVLAAICSASLAASTMAVTAFAEGESIGSSTSNLYSTIANSFSDSVSELGAGITLIFCAVLPIGISIIGLYSAVGAGKKILTKLTNGLSDCIRILMELSGLPFDLVHNHTTMDAPETVRYIRSIPNIQIDYPETTIHQLIVKKHVPPTRIMRYCCMELKERGGVDRFVITGVRWSESVKRRNRGIVEVQRRNLSERLTLNNDNDEDRRLFENCQLKGKRVLNPIIDWTDEDVWEFLKYYGCESNPLYQCGYKRIGCVGCPNDSKRKEAFELYPRFKNMYIRTFDRMLQSDFYKTKTPTWKSGEEVFDWWVSDKQKKIEIDVNQLTFENFESVV